MRIAILGQLLNQSLGILKGPDPTWYLIQWFSNWPSSKITGGRKWKKVKSLNRVQLFATSWTVAYQAPPSMEFSRQECWSGLPFPSSGDLPNPGIQPRSPAFQADALPSEPLGKNGEDGYHVCARIFISRIFLLSLLIWYSLSLAVHHPWRLPLLELVDVLFKYLFI